MGYFASIARQSGVRFSGDLAPSRARVASVPLPEPLDLQTTVMVPAPPEAPAARFEARAPQHAEPSVDLRERTSRDTRGSTSEESKSPSPPVSVRPPDVRPPGDDERPTGSPDEERPEKPTSALPGQTRALKEDAPPALVIERTRFVAQPGDASGDGSRADVPVASARPSSGDVLPTRHFARTAEFVEGSRANPAEIETVVLREVQEWIAAGGESGRGITEDAVRVSRNPLETDAARPPIAPSPGVARIDVKRNRDVDAEVPAPQTAPIEEHRFELSIGTINVVIEGEDRPVQPSRNLSPDRTNRDTRQTTPHHGSRLSRCYL